MMVSREKVLFNLYEIGLRSGDIVFVTADLSAVGFYSHSRAETARAWIEILRQSVGSRGTVIVAGYTKSFIRFKKDPTIVFDRKSEPTSGALARAFLQDPAVRRSSHPVCSYFGFGPQAEAILSDHDASSLSYTVIGRIIEFGGKNLMLGTVDRKNAPMTFHYSQETLGHTMQNPYCGWMQSYYKTDDGQVKLFTRWDCGGCSCGAYHLYGALTVGKAVVYGTVGNAFSAVINGPVSYQIIRGLIEKNRRITLCDDLECISCYGNWRNFGFRAGAVLIKKIKSKIMKILDQQRV
jgi:aminoglycoside 3-N-acetyltransferase